MENSLRNWSRTEEERGAVYIQDKREQEPTWEVVLPGHLVDMAWHECVLVGAESLASQPDRSEQ